jgi:hypothetical protein
MHVASRDGSSGRAGWGDDADQSSQRVGWREWTAAGCNS